MGSQTVDVNSSVEDTFSKVQQASVTITVTSSSNSDSNFGCRVPINSNGESGERILQTLVSTLR